MRPHRRLCRIDHKDRPVGTVIQNTGAIIAWIGLLRPLCRPASQISQCRHTTPDHCKWPAKSNTFRQIAIVVVFFLRHATECIDPKHQTIGVVINKGGDPIIGDIDETANDTLYILCLNVFANSGGVIDLLRYVTDTVIHIPRDRPGTAGPVSNAMQAIVK